MVGTVLSRPIGWDDEPHTERPLWAWDEPDENTLSWRPRHQHSPAIRFRLEKQHLWPGMDSDPAIRVRKLRDSKWEARLVDGETVRLTVQAHSCPDAINALHARIDEEPSTETARRDHIDRDAS